MGRCLLSLQQSERMLKALLHDSAMTVVHSGRSGEGAAAFELQRPHDAARLRTMTLGALVSAFFGEVVDDAQEPRADTVRAAMPDDKLSIRTRMSLSLDAQQRAELEASVRRQVALRNELVHHLVERFDLRNLDGCAQALAYLQSGFEQAERFRAQLQGFAQAMVQVSLHAADQMKGPAFESLLFSGRIPLAGSPVVAALEICWQACARAADGTVRLSELQALMRSRYPQERPENYGRTSWPQLIHESRNFALLRQDASGRRGPPRVRKLGSP